MAGVVLVTFGAIMAAGSSVATARPVAVATARQIDGLVVIGTGSVMPLYTTGAAGTPVPLPSGSGLIDAAFAPNGLTAYVVNAGADAVTPVSIGDGSDVVPGADIATGPDPVAIAVTPNGKYALVADNHGKKVGHHYQYWVQWIDLATNTVVAHARVGISPIEIAITPDGRYAYVTNAESGTVTPIKIASHRALRPIHVGFDPEAMAITPNGRYAYVANNASGTVTPIRVSDNKALRAIRVGSFPAAIAITPNGKFAYVTNNGSGTVSKIRISTRTVTATIRTARYPDNIVITPNGKSAYVGSFDGQAIRTHLRTVTAINLTTDNRRPRADRPGRRARRPGRLRLRLLLALRDSDHGRNQHRGTGPQHRALERPRLHRDAALACRDMSNDGNEAARLPVLRQRWQSDLAAWAIPEHITAAVAQSPWVLPRNVFARRADRLAADPSGPSFEQEWAALDPPGSVLDVGSGAGAACLPLLPRCTGLIAVDAESDMLELLSQRAAAAGQTPRLITGIWPDVAAEAGKADLVTCHHVSYNVPEIEPFVAALTAAARRLVVLEMTAAHPLVSLNPLWLRFHGLIRPAGPTADHLLAILAAMGIRAGSQRWLRQGGPDYESFAELTDVTRRRLCLPPERADDVGRALAESGIDPVRPVDLGTSGREVVSIWWDGRG
jgi:YVTN family beta-propeller protein